MEYKIAEIAERIRGLRSIVGLDAQVLADATGETLEHYTEYENGEHDFSFGFLYHCAETLGVDIVELLTGESPHLMGYTLVRSDQGLPIHREEGFDYFHLAANFKDKLAEPFIVKAPYHEEKQSMPVELSSHEGQEFDYILSGRMRFVYEGHIEELNPGDSIYYSSNKPHGIIATGGEECVFLAMVIKSEEEN